LHVVPDRDVAVHRTNVVCHAAANLNVARFGRDDAADATLNVHSRHDDLLVLGARHLGRHVHAVGHDAPIDDGDGARIELHAIDARLAVDLRDVHLLSRAVHVQHTDTVEKADRLAAAAAAAAEKTLHKRHRRVIFIHDRRP
jgi:hypothetical protein